LTITYGDISQRATSPVRVALPVVTSTNHGNAMAETRVPVSDTAMAVSTPASDQKLYLPDASAVRSADHHRRVVIFTAAGKKGLSGPALVMT
jgi:hypothetical protein